MHDRKIGVGIINSVPLWSHYSYTIITPQASILTNEAPIVHGRLGLSEFFVRRCGGVTARTPEAGRWML